MIKGERCIPAIKQWMSDKMLKLNDDKPEFLIVTENRSRTCKFDIQVGAHMIQSSPNLGVIFDSNQDITSMYDQRYIYIIGSESSASAYFK